MTIFGWAIHLFVSCSEPIKFLDFNQQKMLPSNTKGRMKMKKSYILIILISLLVLSPKLYAQQGKGLLPATCDDLVTDIDM